MRADSTGRTQMMSFGAPSSFVGAGPQRLQPREQLAQRVGVEAGADLAAILQLAVDPFAERQRGEPLGRLGDRVAGDDEVADLSALVLVQVLRAAALIGRRGALRDDAFEPHLGRPLVERAARRRRHGR